MLQTVPLALVSGAKPAFPRVSLDDPISLVMAEIGKTCDGPSAAIGSRIGHALRVAAATPGFLPAEFRAPRPDCYARHTIASDPAGRFTLLAIVWAPGQFSPPHAHDTWCAYAVADNALSETLYRYDPARKIAVPVGTATRAAGYACFAPAGLEQIHRLGNAGDVPAISIHVYGVEGSRVGTHVNRLMDVAERER